MPLPEWEEELFREIDARVEKALVERGHYELNAPLAAPPPGEPTPGVWHKIKETHEEKGDSVEEISHHRLSIRRI